MYRSTLKIVVCGERQIAVFGKRPPSLFWSNAGQRRTALWDETGRDVLTSDDHEEAKERDILECSNTSQPA